TTKAPARPCGRPTRPTKTRSGNALEVRARLFARGERRLRALVLRAPKLDVGAEERPVRARLRLVWHADAARIDDAIAARAPVVLDMCVPAHDDLLGRAAHHLHHLRFRR